MRLMSREAISPAISEIANDIKTLDGSPQILG